VTTRSDDDRRRRLLDAVLLGELDPAATEVVEACRADAAFAAELAHLQRIQHRLAAHGREVRADLEQPANELEAVAEAAMLRAGRAAAPRRRLRWLAALAAAAVLVVASIWWYSRPAHDGAQLLGGFHVVPAADGRGLTFAHTLTRDEHFVLTVVDGRGSVVFESRRWTAQEWQPDPELAARWRPDWTVTVVVERSDAEPLRGVPLHGWMPRR
jgi:hypothetical protein